MYLWNNTEVRHLKLSRLAFFSNFQSQSFLCLCNTFFRSIPIGRKSGSQIFHFTLEYLGNQRCSYLKLSDKNDLPFLMISHNEYYSPKSAVIPLSEVNLVNNRVAVILNGAEITNA